MSRVVALLRGVNLGPNRAIDMGALREVVEAAGYADVRTHLRSGNVVLSARDPADAVARALEARLHERFGVEIAVVARTRDELADAIARNPLADVAADPRRLQVTFFAAAPDPGLDARLQEAAAGEERAAVSGREAYTWHPDGIHASKLAKVVTDKRHGGTARNWNTVTRLLELAGE